MKTELVSVTPSLAREWLKKNTKNRAIRNSHVETLRQSFARGEQVTTHQGIAFDTDGILIDGQHRLSAIALMHEGFSFLMMVTWGLDRADGELREGCDDCRRRTDPPHERQTHMSPPALVVFECHTRIAP